MILRNLPSNFESTYKKPPFINIAIFFLRKFYHYHGRKGEAINLILHYMIDGIYKTVKPSHLKKLQIIQNIKNLMFQVIFTFSE